MTRHYTDEISNGISRFIYELDACVFDKHERMSGEGRIKMARYSYTCGKRAPKGCNFLARKVADERLAVRQLVGRRGLSTYEEPRGTAQKAGRGGHAKKSRGVKLKARQQHTRIARARLLTIDG